MIAIVLGGLLGFGFIGLLILPRYLGTRRIHAATTAPFHTIRDGSRWLPCHTTVCGHITTRHEPTGDGGWLCTGGGCGHITKGDQ
ncbi:hypothetical protein [Streptomyces sp. NPDC093097]|uniref:hypothetical protein n=1 Tax=Streptomyces sp. NPDC093097 TaxID=3366027 RepID=UPI003828870B